MTEKKKLAQTLPSGADPRAAPATSTKAEPQTSEIAVTRELSETTIVEDGSLAETLDGSLPGASEPAPDMPGYVVARRYRLVSVLGRGAHGRVWEAEDLLTGGKVALKVLSPDLGVTSARIRREVASMRMLRLSGVVQLLDEGTEGDRPFIVMERVKGAPFPGVPVPAPWATIAPAAIALLETLSRMHAFGIVHRDLKPANVLVDDEGRPTILDFGLARGGDPLDEGVTDHGTILGTPAYLAPEQVQGEPATARSDLYAVGVMIFEALSGRFPHPLENVMRMLRARVTQPPAPIASVAPDVPRAVAAVIDALLVKEPAGRPRSALEVLDQLRGRHAPKRPALRRLGPQRAVAAIVEAAAAGASLDVNGPRGSGLTRCLDDAEAELAQRGIRVLRATTFVSGPSSAAVPTVRPGVPREVPATPPRVESEEEIEQAIRDALAGGAVVMADDAELLDPPLMKALARCRGAGSIIRAFVGPQTAGGMGGGAGVADVERSETRRGHPSGAPHLRSVSLSPLDESDLVALFAGTSRLFHIPEDAARVLHRRTDGLPARVADDVTGWVQAGLARWDGDRVSVDRDVIERLEAGLVITPLGPLPPPAQPLPPELDDLLRWIALAHPNGNAAHLALARHASIDVVEAQIADLEARGALRVLPDGRLEPSCAPTAGDAWPLERRREAHRSIAFAEPRGTPRRLFHLITGADDDTELGAEIAAEAQHLARRLAIEGRLALASAAVGEGLRAERRLGMSGAVESLPLLTLAVEIALEDGTPRALDRALYELYRVQPRSPAIERLAHLVRAALAVFQRTPRAFAEASKLEPFANLDVERRRHELRVVAARVLPEAEQEALLDELQVWAEASDSDAARGAHAGWLARMRYRQGRYAEAAELHATSAASTPWVTSRLAAQLRSASCRMEAFQLEQAGRAAMVAREEARRYRLPFIEAAAERILRSIAYRTGAAKKPDVELVEAAGQLRVGDWEAMLGLNEAAVAFRAGDRGLARDLAKRARLAWAAMGEVSGGALLAAALELACGGDATTEEVDALVRRALADSMAWIAVPALGLVAMSGRAPSIDGARLSELVATVDPATWDQRLEVLSIREAMDALSSPAPSPP